MLTFQTAYAQGWTDGVEEMILQLRNVSMAKPDGGYTGPVPEELELWLQTIEKRLKEVASVYD